VRKTAGKENYDNKNRLTNKENQESQRAELVDNLFANETFKLKNLYKYLSKLSSNLITNNFNACNQAST